MKSKKLLVMVLVVILVFLLASCGSKTENGNENFIVYDGVEFVKVASSRGFSGICFNIVVHKQTRVMYIFTNGGYSGGLSIMLDENGKPLLWEGEL